MIYEVYIQTNENGYITAVNSSEFLTDTSGWIKIDEGYGDKYHHAHGNYFPLPIITYGCAYRYKMVDGVSMECTAEEIVAQEEANKSIKQPTAQDDTDAMMIDHEYRLTLLELGIV